MISHMIKSMHIQKKNIILIGQSIGTGVAIEFAYKNKWSYPIILISPYKSIITVATETTTSITQWIDKYPSAYYVKYLDCPIKIFHGTSDEIIPISHGEEVFKNIKNKAFEPTWIKNVGHNNILENINNSDILKVINYAI